MNNILHSSTMKSHHSLKHGKHVACIRLLILTLYLLFAAQLSAQTLIPDLGPGVGYKITSSGSYMVIGEVRGVKDWEATPLQGTGGILFDNVSNAELTISTGAYVDGYSHSISTISNSNICRNINIHNKGTIRGSSRGIDAQSTENLLIINDGLISTTPEGKDFNNNQGYGDDAISISGGSTVINNNTVEGNWGIYMNSNSSDPVYITNNSKAIIRAVNNTVSLANNAGTITNAGSIISTRGHSIYLTDQVSVTNQAGGLLQGNNGVRLEDSGTVKNYGIITGKGKSYGIHINKGTGLVENNAGATINNGIYAGGTTTVANNGKIEGYMGVVLSENSTLSGSGTIDVGGVGLTLLDKAKHTALTSIKGDSIGVSFSGTGTLTNSTAITGTRFHGVYSQYDSVNIINRAGGTITGGQYGLNLMRGTVVNAGEIKGDNGIYAGYKTIITNQSGGSITGTTYAVELISDAANELHLLAGSTTTGDIYINGADALMTIDMGNSTKTLDNNIMLTEGTLTKKEKGTLTLSGELTGAFSLIAESGKLVLSGDNYAFTGTITIKPVASLEVSTVSSLPPAIVNNGTLYMDQVDNETYAGTISGTGNVQKSGAGTLTLSGTNTYTGNTTINEGTLVLNTGLLDSDIILSDATLGTTGAITVKSIDCLAGGSITQGGILTITNDLTLQGNNNLFSFSGGNNTVNNAINAGGEINFGNSSNTINVDFSAPGEYTLMSAAGGFTGFDAGKFTVKLNGGNFPDNLKVELKREINSLVLIIQKIISDAIITVTTIPDQTYTGSEIKPEPLVKDGNTTLVKDTDYILTYSSDKTNVGTVTITITGKGNYTGTRTTTFDITEKAISEENIMVTAISDQTYTGSEIKPEPLVKDGNTTLVKDTDYIVAYSSDKTNVGTVTITITGKGNYTGTKTTTFDITEKAISEESITVATIPDQTYTGSEIKPEPEVKDGSTTLVKYTDYTLSYSSDKTNVGTVTVTITGKGNYAGTRTTTFDITKKAISEESITVATIPDQTYTGSEIKPEPEVKDGSTVLVKDTDYTLSYSPNMNVGTVTLTITGKGNYDETRTTTFMINKAAISVTTDAGQSKVYQTPDPVFTYQVTSGQLLGDDSFTGSLSRIQSENAGTYTIGQGSLAIDDGNNGDNYSMSFTGSTFEILPASQSISFTLPTELNIQATSGEYQLTATATSGLPVSYRSDNTTVATISGTTLLLKQSGSVNITAYVESNPNYTAAQEVSLSLVVTSSNTSVTETKVSGSYVDPVTGYHVMDCGTNTTLVTITTEDPNSMVIYNGTEGNTFTIDTSRPDIYNIRYTVRSQDGSRSQEHSFAIEKRFNFDDIIVQKWNNVLLVNNNQDNNGGYSFTNYKWYKDGNLIGTGNYYSAGDNASDLLDSNALYSVQLTTSDGKVLRTCEALPARMPARVKAYPNPIPKGEELTLEISLPNEILSNAVLYVFTQSGKQISVHTGLKSQMKLDVPYETDIYFLKIQADDYNEIIKVIVK